MGDPDARAEGRRWARAAKAYLAEVADAVQALRRTFEAGPETPVGDAADPASSVQDACAALDGWLATTAAPRGLRKAGAELGAAAATYRNAAVAFRSLADREPETRGALSFACKAMLQQGDHHLESFATLVAKVDQ